MAVGSPPPPQELIPLYWALAEEFGGPVGRMEELEPGHFHIDGGISAPAASASVKTRKTAATEWNDILTEEKSLNYSCSYLCSS